MKRVDRKSAAGTRGNSITMVPLFLLLWMILLLLWAIPSNAARLGDSLHEVTGSGPSVGDTLWADIKESGTDAFLLFTAPLRWNWRDWSIAGGVIAGTGGLTAIDESLHKEVVDPAPLPDDTYRTARNFLGTWIPSAVVFVSLYTTGLVFDEPGVRRAGRHVAESVFYAGLITTTLKAVIGRGRPPLNQGPHLFHGVSFNDDYHSLPSGHATIAFALCSSLAADIDNPWVSVGLYSLATVTAVSRVYDNRHWPSDVFLGAAIGIACGYGVANFDNSNDDQSGLYLYPNINGIGMLWRF